MKQKLTRLLEAAYELEGLLMLALSKDENEKESLDTVCRLVASKANRIADEISTLDDSEDSFMPSYEPATEEPVEHFDEEPDAEPVVEEEEMEKEAILESEPQTEPQDEPVEEEEFINDVENDVEAEEETEIEAADDTGKTEIIGEKPLDEESSETEEIISRQAPILPIRFSLNDKFRFRREIFCNSDSEMKAALAMISSCETIEEVEDYVYNELRLDPDLPVVGEFMGIIENHFAR